MQVARGLHTASRITLSVVLRYSTVFFILDYSYESRFSTLENLNLLS